MWVAGKYLAYAAARDDVASTTKVTEELVGCL